MAYPKGKPRPAGSGRAKGTPNKATKTIREAWIEATGLAGINRILKPLTVKVRCVVALKFWQAFGVQALLKRGVHAANLLTSRV